MSFLKPVININEREIHINSLPIGDVITLREIITFNSKAPGSDNTITHNIFIGTLKNDHFSTNSHLWVRHFLNSCEFEGNVSILEGLTKKSPDKDDYNFPKSIQIIGFNSKTEKVIVKPEY